MGLRYRTPISTLHEQRRRAEREKSPQRITASHLRIRALESLRSNRADTSDGGKSRELLERLRQALQGENSQSSDASQEYHSLQDELARVNMRQMNEQSTSPADLDVSMDAYRPSTQPVTLVLVNPAETKSFPKHIRRLESPLSSFASYLPSPAEAPAPRTLTLAPEMPRESLIQKDHSDHAAQLVQDAMTESRPTSADTQISASLALSLLND